MKKVSFVLPAFNEGKNIDEMFELIHDWCVNHTQYNYEIIYVNDGSSDDSLVRIRNLSTKHKTVRYLSFSRNFGKEAAVTAGIGASQGDFTIVMDCDGQHPIKTVDDLIREYEKGYNLVFGVRKNRSGEGLIKRLTTPLFYWIMNRVLGVNIQPGLTDFCLVDRKVAREFLMLSEKDRNTRSLILWTGFSQKFVPFNADRRISGSATYSTGKLIKLAFDSFVSMSYKPLYLSGLLGFSVTALSGMGLIFIAIEQVILGDPLSIGVTSNGILALFIAFLVGVILLMQGVNGMYVAKITREVQNRPLYIIEETEVEKKKD